MPVEAREYSRSPGPGEGCESPHECWGRNLGSLEEQSVLLTTELSLQSREQPLVIHSHVLPLHRPKAMRQSGLVS